MLSHGQIAACVRARKAAHPERYCPEPRCLWATANGTPCPKHPNARHRCVRCAHKLRETWEITSGRCAECPDPVHGHA